ncbi:LolA-like outer membrane lipoprotein chaperone [Sulfurimonas autotrophica]|uniref:Outer membrane lipoprotein carrier protein LolA n=1 Tax=Sulfurimonas autotrophica (strain ATCC BAA-671 / DSM 16294 / JCM 11897 / OK10) TaxID=563040 RepID=E0USJ3_SULAO|nr:LolA-like outer membrane lipoprotein chaperone [Sulfurimonas autotrophica]ADN09156.1 outer membrane lipoprotein carrier protein LolA [Sulfurimonas autotrophica DSM 16294]
MKRVILAALLATSAYATLNNINSFEADFLQNITDDKGVKITYSGHITASKPRYALWQYHKPIQKSVYILPNKIIVIEPDLEQVIIKHLNENFDLFKIIHNAKKIDKNKYLAKFKNKEYIIKIEDSKIKSISYKDELDNDIKIMFKNQEENKKISKEKYIPHIPDEYDIVTE